MVTQTKNDEHYARIKDAGKELMKAMYLQVNPIFTKGMPETTFIELIYAGIKKEKRTKEGIAFFQQLYSHLSKNRTISEIDKDETGETTLALYNKAWSVFDAKKDYSINNSAMAAVIVDSGSEKLLCPWWIIALLALLALLMKGDSEHHENR